jgi:hypothetical protein
LTLKQVLLLVIVTPVGAVELVPTVTVSVLSALVPHVLDAVTLMVPPEVPVVTVIVLVPFPELIVQPAGTVQA